MAGQYDYSQLATYLGNIVDEAINSTMAMLNFSGSVQSGFMGYQGGVEPIRISPLGAQYEGSTLVQGGQVTSQVDGSKALFIIPPSAGMPFSDLPSMQAYFENAVNALFDPWWQMPQPGDFDAQVGQAQQVASLLNYHAQGHVGPGNTDYFPVSAPLAYIKTMQERVSNLDGNAIIEFQANFSDRIGDVVDAQACAAILAWVGVKGEQSIWKKTQESLANIAGAGVDAMKHARPSSGGGGIKALINVLGAISLVAAEVVTEGWATPLVVAGVAAQTSSDFIPEKPEDEERPLGAGDPFGVLDNLRGALEDLKGKIRQEETWLSQRLQKMTNLMYGGGRGAFDLSQPALVHEDRKSQLYQATEIKADYDAMRTVAQDYMPKVVDVLTKAGGLTDDSGSGPWSRPGDIGLGSTGPYYEWTALNTAIQGATADTAKSLDYACQALIILANDFGKTDGQVKHDMDGLATRLDKAQAAASRNAH